MGRLIARTRPLPQPRTSTGLTSGSAAGLTCGEGPDSRIVALARSLVVKARTRTEGICDQ